MRVVFDTHIWLESPDRGFYFFCTNLLKELQKDMGMDELVVYGIEDGKKLFANDVTYWVRKRLHKYWLFLSSKYDIWHSSTQVNSVFPKSGQKIVLTVHDLNFLHEPGISGIQIKDELKRLQAKIDRADEIVTISRFTKNEIEEYLSLRNKTVSVIYNGCNIHESIGRLSTYRPLKPFLLTIGTVTAKKNFHVLPCLLKDNDYELIIVGSVYYGKEYCEKVMSEVRKYKVEDRVKILGVVDDDSKHWYLQHCDAFLFPSLAEGFGLPPIEAMRYGKRCFLSNHTSLPEIGGDVACYFSDMSDPHLMRQEFSEGLSLVIDAEDIVKRAELFSWKKAAMEYMAVYSRLSKY